MLGQEWHRKPKDGRATRCKRPRSLTVLELTKEVCADFLQTSLCEGKINFHLVSTFFFSLCSRIWFGLIQGQHRGGPVEG